MTLFLKDYATEQVAKILSWSPLSCKFFKATEVAEWWIRVPSYSTFRVNTLCYTVEECVSYLQNRLTNQFLSFTIPPPEIRVHDLLSECIIIGKLDDTILDLNRRKEEVVVDASCGAAVLRGANVFAPGVVGMLPTTQIGSEVSIYADLTGTCLKGYKQIFSSEGKLFLGNGIAKMNRFQLFDGKPCKKGVALELKYPASGLMFPHFPSNMGILQNLPSMVCVKVLDPKPGDLVLDMCAAPGNKTSHIGILMNDEGTVIAIDRKNKLPLIVTRCSTSNLRNCVKVFAGDSTKLIAANTERAPNSGPPFSCNTFDKILLDAACSGTGLRPSLNNKIHSESTTLSFSVLQKRFIDNAVSLLKRGGILVYSTCSILCEENECLVAWTLKKYPEMSLVPAEPILGGPGLPQCGLTEKQRFLVQRFDMNNEVSSIDSIGFFIAKFMKK